MVLLTRERVDQAAGFGAALILFALAVYVHHNRYAFIDDFFGKPFFWDSKVFMAGGLEIAQGRDPYAGHVWNDPFPLPFISPPAFTLLLGAVAGPLHEHVFEVLAACHIISLVVTPLILTRLFLGPQLSDAALGYGLFICGFGAWGVTTVLAGNFGSTLYLLIFAALASALKTNKWLVFHIAVGFACQVKMPYALFWAVPVMLHTWDWKQFRDAAIAAVCAAAPYVAAYAADPAFFRDWLNGLSGQVATGDVGFSVYGAVFSKVWPDTASRLPMIVHALAMAALFAFLLKDRTNGNLRLAALIVFVILANPRMKEYDMAFAAIPAGALYLAALAPQGSSAMRRAFAIGGLLALMIFVLKADRTPIVGAFVYAAVFASAVLSLRLRAPAAAAAHRRAAAENPP